MTVGEFAGAIETLRRRHGGLITSWGRTDEHSVAVGGFASDPHTWGLGADMVYHIRPDIVALTIEAEAAGLRVIREELKPHDHYQPLDFPSGPVTRYDGEVKTWA